MYSCQCGVGKYTLRMGWPNQEFLDGLGIDLPILQAPMAGANLAAMAIAVSDVGGLGALPCAMLSIDKMRSELEALRSATSKPYSVNFFCHKPPVEDPERERAWQERLLPYYEEWGIDASSISQAPSRRPFDEAACELIEELKPPVVSFHFGLPEAGLLERVKGTGAKILSTATTVSEARWLEAHGCDAIIAQGVEAGGHRGCFLDFDLATQVGTMALVPQIVDAVDVPVIATGGIADARGILAALALGASAVQLGTAYLLCPEATIGDVHRQALKRARDDSSAITNIFSGRAARGIVNRFISEVGPISDLAPEFPLAGVAVAPLRAASEAADSTDFAQMWAGQAAAMAREMPAGEITRKLAAEVRELLASR